MIRAAQRVDGSAEVSNTASWTGDFPDALSQCARGDRAPETGQGGNFGNVSGGVDGLGVALTLVWHNFLAGFARCILG